MQLGNYCEGHVVQALANSHDTKGYSFFSEPSILINGFGGYIDLLKLRITEGVANYEAPQNEVFEVKAITTVKRWAEISKKADPDHVAQLSVYLYQTKIKKGQIVYFNAAQQGETNPADSLNHKDDLDFTFDKNAAHYKVYKFKLAGTKNSATSIVEPYLVASEEVTISVEDFTRWVQTQTLPTFYNKDLENQEAGFFGAYEKLLDEKKTLQANVDAATAQINDINAKLTLADEQIVGLMKNSNLKLIVTPNHVMRVPGFKKVFDTKAFQKEHKDVYDKCKVTKKTFDAKIVKKDHTELYDQYSKDEPDGRVKVVTNRVTER
jgi:hypothetical protein